MLLKTNTCPMHPYNFFNLVSVNGFNKVNGYKWKNRMDLIKSDHNFWVKINYRKID